MDKDPVDPELSAVYATLPRETPPDHLDAAILAAARRAGGSQPRKPAYRFPLAWRLPVAVAAVVVLSVSLVTLMIDEGGQQLEGPQVPASPRTDASEPKPQGTPPNVAGRPAPAERKASDAALSGELMAKKRLADSADALREPQASPAIAESKEAGPIAQTPAESGVGRSEARDAAPSPAGAPAAVPMAEAPAVGGYGADRAAESERAAVQTRARRQRMTAEGQLAAIDETDRVKRLIGELDEAPPEKWLARISELRRDRRDAEADEVLAAFRKRFPHYVVPQQFER